MLHAVPSACGFLRYHFKVPTLFNAMANSKGMLLGSYYESGDETASEKGKSASTHDMV